MSDVFFYHLRKRPLIHALGQLLEKCLTRGWRVVVQVDDEARVEALNGDLWTFDPASFLPHGSAADGDAADQPIYVMSGAEAPNGAKVRILLNAAGLPDLAAYTRVVFLFEDADETAVAAARALWTTLKAKGQDISYWREGERSGWVRQA